MGHIDELREGKTLSNILNDQEHEVSNVRIFTYQRLDWLKRASSLSSSANENLVDPSKEPSFLNPNNLTAGSANFAAADLIAVVELLVPSVFRAVVSLHPAGYINPDAVAFFSPDEGGNYIHARGSSVYHVFGHITEYADKALQYYLSVYDNTSLSLLLVLLLAYCLHSSLLR